MSIKEKSEKKFFQKKIKKLLENKENNSPEKYKSILASKSPNKNKYLSNTAQDFKRNIRLTKNFPFKGFFNKRFNLTKYKESREKSLSLSRSLEKIIKPHKLRGNGIPEDILERIKFLKKICFSDKIKLYYEKRPKRRETTFEELAEYIINFRKKNSELESAMMVYYYICHEIKYLKNNQTLPFKRLKYSQIPENIFSTKRALSIGFTNMFEYFLKKMEIRFKHLEGICKLIPKEDAKFMNLKINLTIDSNSPEKENNKSLINHCWNAIYINRQWYFVDTLLGSGGVNLIDKRSYILQDESNNHDLDYNFNPYFFMIPPKYLINTHRPTEDLWQFTDKTITLSQFLNNNFDDYSQFYKGIYLNNIEFLTHDNPLIKISSKENLVIKLRVKNSLLGGDLYNSTGKEKLSEVKFTYEESTEIYTFEPYFRNKGDYIIKISSRSLNSTDLVYWPLVDYFVKVQNKIVFSHFDKYKIRLKTISGTKDNNKDLILPKLNKTINNFY